ncbi:MAG: ABC transporter permease [Bacteroidetes bacterium]|nr:ABC transporter permease [Bacteroidota bacterium]
MNKALIIGGRVLKQLSKDPRFFGLSIFAPLIIIYFFKLFADSMPMGFPSERYAIPISAFIVHFLSFILCGVAIVQERTRGTLDRILIAGYRKSQIIGGYVLGYLILATIQATAVLAETIWLFDLHYSTQTVVYLFLVIWLLAIVSVMLGIFISTFAKHEGHVFPFIPLIILPSVFLSGMILDPTLLPTWAQYVGKAFPLYYANHIAQIVITPNYCPCTLRPDFIILCCYAVGLLFVASFTLKDTE